LIRVTTMRPSMLKRFVAAIVTLALASGTLMAQTAGSVDPRVRVTEAGTRITGRLMTIDAQVLTLMPDGNRDPVRIPLSSISAADVSAGRRSRAFADLAGVGVGLAAIGVAGASCGGSRNVNDRSEAACEKALLIGLTVGVASGITVAHLIGRERWRAVPLTSLASLGSSLEATRR
jgi:hypothetical protein